MRLWCSNAHLCVVNFALPDLFFSRITLDRVAVEAGSMLFTDDFTAVGVTVVKLCPALVSTGLFAAALVKRMGPIP